MATTTDHQQKLEAAQALLDELIAQRMPPTGSSTLAMALRTLLIGVCHGDESRLDILLAEAAATNRTLVECLPTLREKWALAAERSRASFLLDLNSLDSLELRQNDDDEFMITVRDDHIGYDSREATARLSTDELIEFVRRVAAQSGLRGRGAVTVDDTVATE
ncbi:hypothetical protein [Kutzneria sp. 744]|uniref:hypothetical protein n=1 Tax=Kutzneria sp. (strain 744) TaxID=345341 RepID=UPI0003EECD75|nr:hypothetical protein [Kutzneria sp. 744]EWM19636.1 hypothetical protein KUTG_09940 [Kutzneria sp. 744]